ncbi:hypothetical protein L7F22_043332 [Adiantum nelumboides]|nr:hypothetical protein [Adiantum nelumboides]
MGEPSTSWQNFNFRDDDGSAQGMQALRLLLAKLQEAQANPCLKPSVNNLLMTEDLMLTSTQRLPSSVAPMHLEGGEGVPVMHGPMQANVVPHPLQGPLQTDGAKKKQYHGQERHVGKIREEGDFHDDDDEPPSRSRHKKRTNERRTKRSRRNSSGGSSSSSQSGRSSHGRFPKKAHPLPLWAMGARDYPAALDALSSLITRRARGDGTNRGDAFDLMPRYLQVSGLNEALSELSIIHVAGTKGKGSTCTFSESILGECGYKTGLFTSPHLIDVRERFKINRENVSEQVFLKHFWWCWDKFKINVGIDMPMPTYFRFLTLLAFKIFIEEKVDVAILEVGLGGRFDATNVVRTPTVCGITSLGFDHMEILGYTLPEIAGEKAGIFKPGIPAFTVAQQKEAMDVLQNKASELDIRLQVVSPLTKVLLNGSQLSMEGEHQLSNGALAVALCHCWAQRREEKKHLDMFDNLLDSASMNALLSQSSISSGSRLLAFE